MKSLFGLTYMLDALILRLSCIKLRFLCEELSFFKMFSCYVSAGKSLWLSKIDLEKKQNHTKNCQTNGFTAKLRSF